MLMMRTMTMINDNGVNSVTNKDKNYKKQIRISLIFVRRINIPIQTGFLRGNLLKLALRSQLINNIYIFKELAYIYYDKYF